jgi:hypothetical protein
MASSQRLVRFRSKLNRNGEQPPPAIKFLQKFAHGTAVHKQWYGMRSMVEARNKVLKGKRYESLGDPGKRSGRDYAFQYLVATLMTVSGTSKRLRRSS